MAGLEVCNDTPISPERNQENEIKKSRNQPTPLTAGLPFQRKRFQKLALGLFLDLTDNIEII